MRLNLLLAATVATGLAGLAPAMQASAQDADLSASEARSLPGAWLVQLSSTPAANGSNKAKLASEHAAFRAAAAAAGIQFTERGSFDTLWNGLSIEVSRTDAARLKSIAGVREVWPVAIIDAPPRPTAASPELFTALAMTGADIAQTDLGYSGRGIKVAVMDTGIDIDHPDFGGSGTNGTTPFPSSRVAYGYDFVGDSFNADPGSAAYDPVPVPDPVPDDCNGHGSHVAGIVGANGAVTGVAPEVTFGAYRVFGCDGSTTADIMIAAMERAYKDGMDILNMSIGSAFQWPQYPTAVAASRLVERGMVVVTSTGNSGTSGLYAAGAPGLGEKVIATASFDNSHVALNTFTISPDGTSIGYGPATAAPLPPTSGSLPMARSGTVASTADACSAFAAGQFAGQAVLVRRGGCTFHVKSLNAQNAGAAAVVLYNNAAGRFSPTVAGTPAITIPVVAISNTEGALIDSRLAAGAVTMTWTDETGSFVNPTGGLISSFSSYGLSPDLALKPDIGAPGGLIYSTYPLESGGYATISGTSMASPHVAGAAALLLQAKPRTRATDVRTALQNNAEPKPWWGNPGLGFLDNVHRQGAGMLSIDDAILATTSIRPSKIATGESEAGPHTETLTLRNNGAADVTYDLSHVPALSTGPNTFTPAFLTGFASVAFSAPSVTVPAGGSASVDVTIAANAGLPDLSIYGGYVVFTPQGGGASHRVPYAGLKGDYQSKPALTSGGSGFPLVGRATSCVRIVNGECVNGSYTLAPAGYVFDLSSVYQMPSLLVHLDHQVRAMTVTVRDAATGAPVHPVFNKGIDEEYLPRNSTATGFFAFAWDGTRIHSNGYNGKGYTKDLTKQVPDGDYLLEVRVLKANGDASNPAHWETWTSPVITIARP